MIDDNRNRKDEPPLSDELAADDRGTDFELAPAVAGNHEQQQIQLEESIATKEARKLKARREQHRNIWFGLGMFGIVGWSVAVPALVGVALGLWIDSTWPSAYSWSLMLLVVGMFLGCANAWNWLRKEGKIANE